MARIENVNIDGTNYDVGKIATTSDPGVVQVGSGLSITPAGVLSSSVQSDLFIVTVSSIDEFQGTFTADKTYEQILTAFNSGKIPILKSPVIGEVSTQTVVATFYGTYSDGDYDGLSFIASYPDAAPTPGGLPAYVSNDVTFFDFEKDLTENPPIYNNYYNNRSARISIARSISSSSTDSQVPSAKSVYTALSTETGWKYLGQVKLASAGASLTFDLPAQYDNYKIIAAGEMASGSNATCQLQLLRSGSAIPSAWGVLDVNGGTVFAGTRDSATDQFSMGSCNQYDTINMEMTSFKTAPTQWRKYQGYQTRMGSAYVMRQYNGRFSSSTEPNQVRIWTNATFGAGAVIKVWASNNT